MFAKCRLRARWRDLVHVLEHGLDRPPALDQRMCGLFADALYARHVVGGIAEQREVVRDAFGRHPEPLRSILRVVPLLCCAPRATVPRVEYPDSRAHQLEEVLVAGHDHRFHAAPRGLPRQRADHIISLEAIEFEDRDAVGRENLRDALDPGVEVGLLRRLQPLTRRLVFGVSLVAKGKPCVMHPPEVLRMVPFDQPAQELQHAAGDRGILALAADELLVGEGEERAIDQRVAVDEEEAGRGSRGHSPRIIARGGARR